MSLLQGKICEDLKQALKARNLPMVQTLRLLNAAILNREKEKRQKIAEAEKNDREEQLQQKSRLSDEEIQAVIFSEIKKRKEAIPLFEKGKRLDLVEKETEEMEILQHYLPEQISDEELKELVL